MILANNALAMMIETSGVRLTPVMAVSNDLAMMAEISGVKLATWRFDNKDLKRLA